MIFIINEAKGIIVITHTCQQRGGTRWMKPPNLFAYNDEIRYRENLRENLIRYLFAVLS